MLPSSATATRSSNCRSSTSTPPRAGRLLPTRGRVDWPRALANLNQAVRPVNELGVTGFDDGNWRWDGPRHSPSIASCPVLPPHPDGAATVVTSAVADVTPQREQGDDVDRADTQRPGPPALLHRRRVG